jgi:hypothetical protein
LFKISEKSVKIEKWMKQEKRKSTKNDRDPEWSLRHKEMEREKSDG